MRIAKIVAALFGLASLACVAGCSGSYGNTGIYTSANANDAAMVQLVETPDHHITGRLEDQHFGPDGVIADDVLVIDGTASGQDMTLLFHPSWSTAGLSATAQRAGDQLKFALRNEMMTLRRNTLQRHLDDEKVVYGHASLLFAQRAQAAAVQAQHDAAIRSGLAQQAQIQAQHDAAAQSAHDEQVRQENDQLALVGFDAVLQNDIRDVEGSAKKLDHSRQTILAEEANAADRTAAAKASLSHLRDGDDPAPGSAHPAREIVEALGRTKFMLGQLKDFDIENSTKLQNIAGVLEKVSVTCSAANSTGPNSDVHARVAGECANLIGDLRSLQSKREETRTLIADAGTRLQSEMDSQTSLVEEARSVCAARRSC